ncbi:3-HAO-domain-containing protein [Polychaeton citri CBS 116435]|uniref:3-hydroxyanthranilate 3,4-dioxygenase n=1 Tax=Polychaeton citri CBS 116435 TaxID=1314669 RepID=A0A9P4PZX3_9PEZI|nr:3-HAO-domain-containing protein [Polychaeton citri CBS 116435]
MSALRTTVARAVETHTLMWRNVGRRTILSSQAQLHTSKATSIRSPRRSFSISSSQRALTSPLNIPKWLNENAHLLKPPVNNYCVYQDPMTVMIVGGPNARTDYHINETPEFFYQYKGRMLLKTVDGDKFKDIYINEGELFLLPANTPHNPVRFENTVGVVIEQPRPAESLDRLRWYCQSCGDKVHEAAFHCTDLGTQIKTAVNAFRDDHEARTCKKCGEICDVAPKPEVMEKMKNA